MEFRNIVDEHYKQYQLRTVFVITTVYTVNLLILFYFQIIPLSGIQLLWLITPFLVSCSLFYFFHFLNQRHKCKFDKDIFTADTFLTKMIIPYDQIVDVRHTTNFKEGNSMMTAERGIKLVLKNCHWDHVKLSPENEKDFLRQLKYKAPHLNI